MDFEYTVETDKTVDDAVEALEVALKERKFGVLWKLDMTQTLQSKGIEGFDTQYRILEVCSPQTAYEVLSLNLKTGYFLPCKMVVYERAGKTQIGVTRPTTLIGLIDDNQLNSYAETVEKTLIEAAQAAK